MLNNTTIQTDLPVQHSGQMCGFEGKKRLHFRSITSCLVMQCLFVDEDMPWVCYIWPCSARPKYFMTAVASRFPYARRRPCLSTWRSKAACIPAASWQPYYGPTALLLS